MGSTEDVVDLTRGAVDSSDEDVIDLTSPSSPKRRRVEDANSGGADQSADDQSAAASGGNALLAALHKERIQRAAAAGVDQRTATPPAEEPRLSVLSYNVWFHEGVQVEARMRAIGQLVARHDPTFVALQEMTDNIYMLLQRQEWWSRYHATKVPAPRRRYYTAMLVSKSAPNLGVVRPPYETMFGNSIMERSLLGVECKLGGQPLTVATSHLESPLGKGRLMREERRAQVEQAMRDFAQVGGDVIWVGDMNWGNQDGRLPLAEGWKDAWEELRPEEKGYTYDAKGNAMLGGWWQNRLDRVLYRSAAWRAASIEIIGTEAIQGCFYQATKKVRGQEVPETRPVLPSDHYGLLCHFERV
eukprot:jgi/Tetstr1/432033/TSEL_021506.t1